MGTKIINLLIPWITPVIFLLSAQIAVDHGVLGLLGFSIMGAISFLAIFFLKKRLNGIVLGEKLKNLLYTLYVIELIICIGIVVEIIVTEYFFNFVSVSIINVLFITATTIIVLFLQKFNVKWLSVSMVVGGLILSFLIPTLVYLKVSIPTVYSGLHFLANDMLRFDNQQTWLLIINLLIILIVHQILQSLFYGKKVVKERKMGAYLVSALMWGIVPISLGSLAFLAKAQAVWPEQSDQVSILVINRFGGQFGQTLFLVTSIFIIISLLSRMWTNFKTQSFYKGPLTTILFITIPLIVVISFKITLLQVVVTFGLIWGPVLGILLWSTNHEKVNWIMLILGSTVAILVAYFQTMTLGILVGTLVTGVIMKIIHYTTIGYRENRSA